MKFKKKTAMILSFAVGTIMFATTAMAEVISKSGYDQLKDSLKYTAESCSTKLSSYTADMSFVIKDNGTVITSQSSLNKFDVKNQVQENAATSTYGSTKRETYHYQDKNGFITRNNEQNVYYVNEYTSPREVSAFKNPFKEKQASDIEKIADAVVGNLRDSVVFNQNPDGSKELSGSLSEAQIPAIVNAAVSLQCKNSFGNRNNNNENPMPKITQDIFVKEVKGTMVTNKDGLIQSILGTGVLSGKDDDGKEHNLTFELLVKITDVNSTTVKRPDLSGKKVEKSIQRDYNTLSNPKKYIGKYKTDILIEKEGKFEKIGEKFIDIEQIDDKSISGKYHEEYAKGYEYYSTNAKEFNFSGKFDENHFNAPFSGTNSSGNSIKGTLSLPPNSSKVYFGINESGNTNQLFDDQYSRVFN